MKIGIDAKWYFEGPPSGKVVINNLLKYLINQNVKHEIYVFLKRDEENIVFPFERDNVKLVYVWGKNNQLSNLFVVPHYLKKYKIDVALFFDFAPLFTKTKKIIFVCDAIFKSNPEYFTLAERLYFSTIKILSQKSDLVLTISNYERARLIRYDIGKNKEIEVIYMGVDAKYKPVADKNSIEVQLVKEKYHIPDRFLFYVGRINVRKNIPNLLHAIEFINDKSIKLVIAGKKDWKSFDLPRHLKKYGLEDRVVTIGFVEDVDLPIIYSIAEVFCYVSFEEGFGLPPLESLASGVPVVVSNTSSLPEVCGEAGVYCNPNDPKDIAEKINLVLSDNKLRETKIKIGLERAKEFTWEKSAHTLIDLCEKVVAT